MTAKGRVKDKVDRKYEFTGETIMYKYIGVTELHRIRATKDFKRADGKMVHKGDLGGWIENEDSLSHEGNCWVADEAKVLGKDKSVNLGDAIVSENALISENAVIYCCRRITDNARVAGNADIAFSSVFDNAVVEGNVDIGQYTYIGGNSHVFGNVGTYEANIGGNAEVSGLTYLRRSDILDNAKVSGNHLTGCVVKDNVVIEDPLGKATDKPYAEAVGYPHGRTNISDCNFDGNAHVVGQAFLSNVVVTDDALIKGNVEVTSSKIAGSAVIEGKCRIAENSVIEGNVFVSQNAKIENCNLSGDVKVTGTAEMFKKTASENETFADGFHSGSDLGNVPVAVSVSGLNKHLENKELIDNIYNGKYSSNVPEKLATLIYEKNKDGDFDKEDMEHISFSKEYCVENGLSTKDSLYLSRGVDSYIEETIEVSPTNIPGLFVVSVEYRDHEMDDVNDWDEFYNGELIDDCRTLVTIDAKKLADDLGLKCKTEKNHEELLEQEKPAKAKKAKSTSLKLKQNKKAKSQQVDFQK